jgi:hypothetical protein
MKFGWKDTEKFGFVLRQMGGSAGKLSFQIHVLLCVNDINMLSIKV